MEYWAIINQKQEGPLTLDELMALDIADDTPVWHMGLDGWVLASDVPEVAQRLKSNFVAETSPTVSEPSPVVASAEKCPPTYLVWAVLSAIFCCIPFGIPAIIYASQVSTFYRNGNYEEARDRSEKAAMWVIISFVAGLVSMPIQIACSLL